MASQHASMSPDLPTVFAKLQSLRLRPVSRSEGLDWHFFPSMVYWPKVSADAADNIDRGGSSVLFHPRGKRVATRTEGGEIMRIEGLPNLQKVSQPNQRTDSTRERRSASESSDSVEISTTAKQAADLSAVARTAPNTLNPRIEEVRQRVASGFYDSDQVRQEIAGAILDSDSVRPVVDEIGVVRQARQQLESVPDTRPERVDEARERVASGFYDQSEVREATVDGFIDEIV
jgi:anti-sigma28 factor (negative regulator of flagellin synthesis)